MSNMWKEFRDFIGRGNIIDLAVGIIIGTAFIAIVNSLVKDIIMPIIGILLGAIDFASLTITIGSANITYGNFIQAVVNFLIVALVVFLMLRLLMKLQKPKEVAPPEDPEEVRLLREIRDLLKQR
jgi:large conductance mechanosensitive channel